MRFTTGYHPVAALLLLVMPDAVSAGAWPQPPGRTQVILSLDSATADRVYDGQGRQLLPVETWEQDEIMLYVDRGVTRRLTLTGKINYKSYATDTDSFSGINSVELGGRYTVFQGEVWVFALGGSVIGGGEGRRSDFDLSGEQGTDYDLRAYGGRNFRLWGVDGFINLEAARHLRENEADQWRVDATLGVKPTPKWMIMAQTFAGQTDPEAWGYAEWANSQVSVVRNLGPQNSTSVQLALRRTAAGRHTPVVHAAIISLWKTF